MTDVATQVGSELKTVLHQLYGPRFCELILFGSCARGTQHDESDVDFAVVLRDNDFSPASEILRITPYTTPIGLRHNVPVSILPVSAERLQGSTLPVYEAIRVEGIAL